MLGEDRGARLTIPAIGPSDRLCARRPAGRLARAASGGGSLPLGLDYHLEPRLLPARRNWELSRLLRADRDAIRPIGKLT